LIEFRHDSHLVGIAPLLIYPRAEKQILAFMGGGVSDYLDLLVLPEWKGETLDAFSDAILGQPDWGLLDLTDLPSDTALLKSRLREFQQPHDMCSAIRLPATSDELLQMFSNRQRANLRNATSRLNHAGGGEVQLANAQTISEFVEELFHLHTGRWRQLGSPGVLWDENVRVFHRAIVPLLMDSGCLRIYRLKSADRTLAIIEAFFEQTTAFCYMQGFDPDSSYLSPGTQLMFAVMNEAVRAGLRKFDFLRGTETYKSHWRAKPEQTFRITASREQLTSMVFSRHAA
jgi:CelD/BcsL family acetyltransferase involved in cellulose biosynthesis